MAHWDQMAVDGSPMRLYVGMPSLGRAFPAVIVIHHGPGVDKFIEDRVEHLAQQGYLAIAPDLFHRQVEDGDMMTRIGRLRDPEVITDVNAAVNYARRLKDTQLGDVGIIGFCMGGRVAYLMAASKPVFKAAGVFYGGNIMKAMGERTDAVRSDALRPLSDRGVLRRRGRQSLAGGRGSNLGPARQVSQSPRVSPLPGRGARLSELHEPRHVSGRPRARRVGQADPVPAAQPADEPPAASAADLIQVRPRWARAAAPGHRPAGRGVV
jgi:hypothetical protein